MSYAFNVGGIHRGATYECTVGSNGLKTNLLWCPHKDCAHVAEYYAADFVDARMDSVIYRRTLAAYHDAAVDAILQHVRRDHVGHPNSCPRGEDENNACYCQPL